MLRRIPATDPIHLIVESTGLSIVGQGAWAAATHGGHGERRWKKLHLGVDQSGVIVAQDHRAIKRRVKAKQGFREFPAARRTIQGYEAIHMIRKRQARW